MTRLLRIALGAQAIFFAAWGMSLLLGWRNADVVWLETVPVDPRDLLSGHYVALRYAIGVLPAGACSVRGVPGATVYVALAPGEGTVPTRDGAVAVWKPVACRLDRPVARRDERWIAGRVADGGRIVYGIERFYVAEASPLRGVRSGQVIAKVALDAAFRPRIVALAEVLDHR